LGWKRRGNDVKWQKIKTERLACCFVTSY
jgi:hypothetical protein